ncbi:MAG: PDZ domain-containing protein [Ignavibacteria bacterium]
MLNHDTKLRISRPIISILFLSLTFISTTFGQGTRLLRQPTISSTHIAFVYGGDIWVSDFNSNEVRRITSTPAVESCPILSPDGSLITFTSNRSGVNEVYTVPVEGGTPTRLTWYPANSRAIAWTPDGKRILYTTTRETTPRAFYRLWTVPVEGGPSTLLTYQWGCDGSFDPTGKQIVIDPTSRWDKEWRNYRGGQNNSLIILNLDDLSETLIPNNERYTDIQPVWLDKSIYFISDRDHISNIWKYTPETDELQQLTSFTGADVKWLSGNENKLAFEREGYLHLFDLKTGEIQQLEITVRGDFPWAETKWEDVSKKIESVSLSSTGKRVLAEARGEIFTIPVEHGDTRNITRSCDAADRMPLWSPKGTDIAWFSDAGQKEYKLFIASQDGLSEPKSISIGESKMAWSPAWSPDGKYIVFVDDDVRIRIVDIENGEILTADVGGTNLERESTGVTWSPDSKWLAYSKTGTNNFRRIMLYSLDDKKVYEVTDILADSFSPAWDRDEKHLYFLASTNVALGSGWANTSAMQADPTYGVYVINLCKDDESPFKPQSDEEKDLTKDDKKENDKSSDKKAEKDTTEAKTKLVKIDFDNLERRTLALPIPVRNYRFTLSGPEGSVFIAERIPNKPGYLLHKFTLEKKKAEEFVNNVRNVSVSADGKKILVQQGKSWQVAGTGKPVGSDAKKITVKLKMQLNRLAEWQQIFEEAWRYERDYFYDPGMHGRNWQTVHDRYAPLVPYVRHRNDLTYVLDQVNGELSVGHSFVFGGDFPEVEKPAIGLLGADLVVENNMWKIKRIYTAESWNPDLKAPLDQPAMKIKEGYYLVGVEGKELTADDDPYSYFDGTADRQTVIHINDKPTFKEAWKEIVTPVNNENGLRQRAWVEDNRRLVDKLSNGKLAYVWVPNTGGQGLGSFNRYFFAQQDKEGAVIDERFNGGGLLDDYMVDLMTRKLRAAITNEVPNGKPFKLPAGILGPKVLLINEESGSGGDFFPWVFRQQQAGPLIGTRTWGGLVSSAVHYRLVDGGALTAPDNAVFDPINNKWVAENEGVAPDIEVRLDAKSLTEGRDVQIERAVKEALLLLEQQGTLKVTHPPYSKPAVK